MKNPKQKLKNILFLVTVLFAFSCSKDIYEEELLNEKITKKRITFKEFSTNKKAIKEFTAAKNELQSASFESSSYERTQYNQDLNIVIDTDNIQLIEIDDYKTYTIPFLAEGRENKVDNIVIVENGNYIDVMFISYNLTKQQLSQMNFGTIDNTILLRNNNAIETDCNTIRDKVEIWINPVTNQISGYLVTYANPCPGTVGNTYVIQHLDGGGSTGGDGSSSSSVGNFSGINNFEILNFWNNLSGNSYINGGYGTGEIYTLGSGGLGSNASNIGGDSNYNLDNTVILTNPVISSINMQNAAFMLEVSAYLNLLKNQNTVINQFLTNNSNYYQFIINYVLQNGGLTQELKNTINFTLNNIGSVYTTLEQNSNNLTTDELEVLKNNALMFLLNNPDQEGLIFANETINLSINLEIDAFEIWDNIQDYRSGMSNDEKLIFDNIDNTKQLRYLSAGYKAMKKAEELYPNNIILSNLHNGKGDAFRHAAWNGLSSLLIGHDLTQSLTTAHESKPSQYTFNFKEKEMDLFNNEKGLIVAGFSNLSNILTNINQYCILGYLRYLNELDSENKATYNSQLIPTDQ
jgi:hypothetical protein